MTSNSELDPKKSAEVDRLIRNAYVNRQRSKYDLASIDIEKALELDPENLEAQEFAADLLAIKWHLKEARDIYKAIIEKDPQRVSAEEKYAKIVLMIAEGERQKDLLKNRELNPQRRQFVRRNISIAVLLSLAPGFGHLYINEIKKGIAVFCGALAFWILFTLSRPHIPDAISMSPQAKALYFLNNISPAAIIFFCMAVFVHLYSIVDVLVQCTKQIMD